MDIAVLATSIMAGQAAKVQLAVAARMMKMNAEAGASVAQLIEAAQNNGAQLAAGIGGNLDITI